MPLYRIIINNKPIDEYVTGSTPQDAYFDVASSLPLTYQDTIEFEEVKAKSGLGVFAGRNMITASTVSVLEQELHQATSITEV